MTSGLDLGKRTVISTRPPARDQAGITGPGRVRTLPGALVVPAEAGDWCRDSALSGQTPGSSLLPCELRRSPGISKPEVCRGLSCDRSGISS